MKIIVLLKKDGDDLKGEFLSAHNRLKFLSGLMPYAEFTPYIIKEYDCLILRLLKRTGARKKVPTLCHDDICYKVIWVRATVFDTILNRLFGDKFFIYKKLNKLVGLVPDADFIVSHSYYPGYLANKVFEQRGTPYSVTWHGSDIHSNPKNSAAIRSKTANIIEKAGINYFVSKNLLETSSYITKKGNKMVLYNGVNADIFYPFNDDAKNELRANFQIKTRYNVAFIGNLYQVKNVLVLPDVFSNLQNVYGKTIGFHIIGDGYLRSQLEAKCEKKRVNVRFWGNVQPEQIPGIINVMDLIVLPSLKEGLPLVATESLACGVSFLGSDVGGIREVVGEKNVVKHGDNFTRVFSKRAEEILNNRDVVVLDKAFYWSTTARLEYNSLIQNIRSYENG